MALDLGPAIFCASGSHPTRVPAEFSHPKFIVKLEMGTE
jgi:hypothetical protein